MRIKVAVGYLLVAVAAVFAVWYIYMRIAPLAVREDATQGAAYRKVLVTGTTISSLYEASYRANIYLQDPSVDNLEAYDRAIDTVYGHIDSLCRLQIPPEQIGILEEIDPREGTLSVRFEDRTALYTKQEAQDLELAYAATVHKSQGSEFDAVILPLYRTQRQLCYRNLLYTAVTRAKSLLIIVGSRQTLADMVDNNRKTLRYTGLCHMMRETVAVDL